MHPCVNSESVQTIKEVFRLTSNVLYFILKVTGRYLPLKLFSFVPDLHSRLIFVIELNFHMNGT